MKWSQAVLNLGPQLPAGQILPVLRGGGIEHLFNEQVARL